MTWGYICDTHCPRISPTPDMHLKTASITLTKGHARVHEYTCTQMLHLSRRAYKLSRIHATKKTCNIFNRRPAYLFLISAAIVMKACSTLVAFLALVSKKGIPISSAKAWFPEQKIRWTRKSVRTNRDRQQPRPGTVEPDRHHHHKLRSPPPNTPKISLPQSEITQPRTPQNTHTTKANMTYQLYVDEVLSIIYILLQLHTSTKCPSFFMSTNIARYNLRTR